MGREQYKKAIEAYQQENFSANKLGQAYAYIELNLLKKAENIIDELISDDTINSYSSFLNAKAIIQIYKNRNYFAKTILKKSIEHDQKSQENKYNLVIKSFSAKNLLFLNQISNCLEILHEILIKAKNHFKGEGGLGCVYNLKLVYNNTYEIIEMLIDKKDSLNDEQLNKFSQITSIIYSFHENY